MPRVSIRTGTFGADGQEIVLTEYLCDWPGCGNIAERALGGIVELGLAAVVCGEHAVRRDAGGGAVPESPAPPS